MAKQRSEKKALLPAININDFFTPLTDREARKFLIKRISCSASNAADLVAKVRRMFARESLHPPWLPVAWQVRAGFTLKLAARVGPCAGDFQSIEELDFPDSPTKGGIVFSNLVEIPYTGNMSFAEQRAILSNLRKEYELPRRFLSSFVSASLLAGLMLAHYKRTGVMSPQGDTWALTDTWVRETSSPFSPFPSRLTLSGGHNLLQWGYRPDSPDKDVCVIALGVVLET